jgi:hypothetical protein
MKKYVIFREEGNYSETWLLVPENKKEVIKAFGKNNNLEYICTSVIQKNFLDKLCIKDKDYYILILGE